MSIIFEWKMFLLSMDGLMWIKASLRDWSCTTARGNTGPMSVFPQTDRSVLKQDWDSSRQSRAVFPHAYSVSSDEGFSNVEHAVSSAQI